MSGYGQLARRKAQAGYVVIGEKQCVDGKDQCVPPVYSVLFVTVVNLCTSLLGSVFFAHKWFVDLNHLVGRSLFQTVVVPVAWVVLLVIGIGGVWSRSFCLFAMFLIGHIVVSVYLLSQLRRCLACLLAKGADSLRLMVVKRRIRWFFAFLCLLWASSIFWLISFDGSFHRYYWGERRYSWERWSADDLPVVIIIAIFVLAETGLIQKIFNTAVRGVLKNHSSIDAKIEESWRRFGVVAVWCVSGLSVMLFFWDVAESLLYIWAHCPFSYEIYHQWLFFERYCPHAGCQLCLWCVALLIGIFPWGRMALLIKAFLRLVGDVLFPSIMNK